MNALYEPRKKSQRFQIVRLCFLLSATALGLGGCGGQGMSDLKQFVQQGQNSGASRIEPVPAIEPYSMFTYQSTDLRDPFEPPKWLSHAKAQSKPNRTNNRIQPDEKCRREELARFSLDSLRMVGTVEQEQSIWGIVKSPEGTVYRIAKDNCLGQNNGKVVRITEDRIELTEIVPDGEGVWRKRPAALALTE